MPRSIAAGLLAAALLGAALSGIIMAQRPPTLANNDLDLTAILPFLLGIFLAVGGATGILTLALSRRWPALAGRLALTARSSVEQGRRRARASIRQGLLAGSAAVIMLILSLNGWLDLVFAFVVVILVGLVESFVQSREV